MGSSAEPGVQSVAIISSDGVPIDVRPLPNDREFFAALRDAAARVASLLGSDDDRRDALESALRERYPDVEVHVRDDLAGLGAADRLWYALRDGRLDTRRSAMD